MIEKFSAPRILGLLLLVFLCFIQAAAGSEVVLEDSHILVAFDSDTGALTRMEDRSSHWMIERRPELGVSFRLFAPLPNRRYNPVLGQKQRNAEVKKVSDHEVRLQWKDLVSENGGVLPIKLSADVTLIDGALTFSATLQNDSSLKVETIDYPYLGDLNPPARKGVEMGVVIMRDNKADDLDYDEIYPFFGSQIGYWGIFYPLKTREANRSLFCLIQAPDKGLYVEVAADAAPYRLQYTFEQHPGVLSSITNLVPPEDDIAGTPVHLEFRMCHFIFAAPRSTTWMGPVVLRCYQGNRQAGVDLYNQWRGTLNH